MTRAQGKHRECSLNQSVATLVLCPYFGIVFLIKLFEGNAISPDQAPGSLLMLLLVRNANHAQQDTQDPTRFIDTLSFPVA